MGYLRYVALGDSQTEGLNDGDEQGGYRGWADRLAEILAAGQPGFRYANLAVRGKRARQIRAEQVKAALALEPDLVTVMAGMNDLVRPGFDGPAVAADLESMFAEFRVAGATVVSFTFPDITRIAPIARPLRSRVIDFNARIRTAAGRHGVVLVDTFGQPVTTDPRLWSPDRIHATSLGHARVAAATAAALGLPGSDGSWSEPLPALPPAPIARRVGSELTWVGTSLAPWLLRRLRGRSSGDDRAAKRPALLPIPEPLPITESLPAPDA